MLQRFQIFFVLLISFQGQSQTIEPKHTFNIEMGLPNSFTNKPFKDIMQGLVSFEPYYQYKFPKNIIVGAGLKYNYFTINQFKVPIKVLGGMHTGGAFIKVGWEKFHSDRFATDFSMKAGYTQNYFYSTENDTAGANPRQVNCSYLEPTMGFILTADEFASYRFFVSYAFQGFGFRPDMIGLETFGGYDPSESNSVSSYLIVGFGYTYYFSNKN